MTTKDILFEDLRIQRLRFHIVSGEALFVMWDEDASVARALQGTENSAPCARASETNIEVRLEWAWCILIVKWLGQFKLPVRLCNPLVLISEAECSESTAGDKETSCVSGTPVGQAVVDAVAGKLFRGCSRKNKVSLQACVHNLDDDLLIREPNDQTVLGGIAKNGWD
jgi:hypothetical protein